jgi:hypothetical protein
MRMTAASYVVLFDAIVAQLCALMLSCTSLDQAGTFLTPPPRPTSHLTRHSYRCRNLGGILLREICPRRHYLQIVQRAPLCAALLVSGWNPGAQTSPPFDKIRNVSFRNPIGHMRTPSLTRTLSQSKTGPHTSPCHGGIIRLTVDLSARHTPGDPRPSRWRTPEFFLYYAIFIAAVPWMIYVPVQLSSSA